MSETVRGLAVKITADAKDFEKQMRQMRSGLKTTQKELDALQKGLELDYNPQKFAQAQRVVQQALQETERNANVLSQRLKYLESIGSADTDEYRKFQIELEQTSNTAQILRGRLEEINRLPFDRAAAGVAKIGQGLTAAGNAAKPFSAAAAATIAGLGALGLKAVQTADELSTTAAQMGITATELQKMRYVALQTDVDVEKMKQGFIQARGALADLSTGTVNESSKALQKLGIDFSKFESADQSFYAIIDALGGMEDELAMTAAANDIFGEKLANEMIPLIKEGGGAIAEFAAEYETLGGLSDEQVSKLSKFDNTMNQIKAGIQNAALHIGASLLPIMERLAAFVSGNVVPAVQRLVGFFQQLTADQQEFALKALLMVAALAPVLLMMGKVASGVSSLIGVLGNLRGALSLLMAHPIVAVIAAVAAALIYLYTTNENFRNSINALLKSLSPLLEMLGGLLVTAMRVLMKAIQPVMSMLQTLGNIAGRLAPLFEIVGSVVSVVFEQMLKPIQAVMSILEFMIDKITDALNWAIDGINSVGGVFGVKLERIEKIKHEEIPAASPQSADPFSGASAALSSGSVYDAGTVPEVGGTYVNSDNSQHNQTIYITVENYAENVDVDDLVRQINEKMGGVMP
jgi:hypothetical protein